MDCEILYLHNTGKLYMLKLVPLFILYGIAVFFILTSLIPEDCAKVVENDWNTFPDYWFVVGTDKKGELTLLLVPQFSREIVSKFGSPPLEKSEIVEVENELNEILPMAKIYEMPQYNLLDENDLVENEHNNILNLLRTEADELLLENRPITLQIATQNNERCLKLVLPIGNNPDIYYYIVNEKEIIPISFCERQYLTGAIVTFTFLFTVPLALALTFLYNWLREILKQTNTEK